MEGESEVRSMLSKGRDGEEAMLIRDGLGWEGLEE